MVDNPLIPPTSRTVTQPNISKPGGVTPDPKVSKVTTDRSTTARSLVESKEIDSLKLSEKTPVVPEETIPLPILASKELQNTEWAWRRVILQTLMSMMTKAPTPGTQGDIEGPRPVPFTSPASTNQPYAETNPSPALTVGEHEIPLSEGGRLGVSETISPNGEAPAIARMGQEQSNTMRVLWDTILRYAPNDKAETAILDASASDLQGKVVPFANFKNEHLDKLPEKLKDWIVADRLGAAANQTADKITGSGVYFPVSNEREVQNSAVRWKAERQTKLTSTHTLVHRLSIDCQVGSSPVKVTLIAAQPTILLHVATDDSGLRRRLQTTFDDISKSLKTLGWNVDRSTVGTLTEAEESF